MADGARLRARQGRPLRHSAPKNLDVELFANALGRTAPPARTLPLLLQRIRADRQIDTPRIAPLRLILNRSSDEKDHVMPRLDPDSKDSAYLCGRMFAILEEIQRAALGKQLNTTLRDKYFGTAVTAPSSVLVRLHVTAVAQVPRCRAARRRGCGRSPGRRERPTPARAVFRRPPGARCPASPGFPSLPWLFGHLDCGICER